MIRDTSAIDRPIERDPKSRRVLLFGGGALALIVLLALVVPGMRRWASSEASVDANRLRFGTVTRGDLVREVAVQGSVVAAFRPTLTSPARGVAEVVVAAGQVVQKDQVLLRITSPEVQSQLEQQRSALTSAQADLQRQRILARQAHIRREQEIGLLAVQLETAKRAMDRAERTKQMGLTNAVEYEKAQDELKVAGLRLEAAKQDSKLDAETEGFELSNRESQVERQRLVVADLQRQVDELAVRSPVAGLVSRVLVDDRDSVTQGQPLVGVVDLSKLEVEIWVPESYAADIPVGTPAILTLEGKEFAGELASLSPEVEGSRVRGVVAFKGATPAGLKQNQRIPAKLVLETRPNVLKVQRGPFLEAGGGHVAWVVDDDIANRRAIEIGAVSINEVEIVSGLEQGDEIVLSDPSPFGNVQRVMLRR